MSEAVMEPEQVVTLTPAAGLAVEQQREAGLNALARMSDGEFVERLKSLRVGLERFDMMMREVLTTGVGPGFDLMKVDGVDRPVFTLSAAEKTCFVARMCPSFVVERASGTPPDAPAVHYVVHCKLHLGNTEGPVVAEGVGSANSHEKKYRWRYAEKHCPKCGVIGSLIKSKYEGKPGTPFAGVLPWVCLRKRGGCGVELAPNDPEVLAQKMGMVENPEPFDLDNTLLKMAKKRAFVDAAKTATCASNRVTQDLDDSSPGTPEPSPNTMREQITARATALGWKRGDLWTVVADATGKPVKNIEGFARLDAKDLQRVLDKMPAEPMPTHDDSGEDFGGEVEG